MSVSIQYFAWLREKTGIDQETVELPEDVKTIDNLFTWLGSRGEEFHSIIENAEIIQVALDKKHQMDKSTELGDTTEIALFPPMTGG